MARRELTLQTLTADAFAAFGDVIEVGTEQQALSINHGLTQRYHDLAQIDVAAEGGRPVLSIFRSEAIVLPFRIAVMERHPLGSQAFMPLGDQPYAVVVAPAGEFDTVRIAAFLAGPHQGVNYHRGTWHHYCLALNARSDFLVIDRAADDDNCDELVLPEAEEIYVRR